MARRQSKTTKKSTDEADSKGVAGAADAIADVLKAGAETMAEVAAGVVEAVAETVSPMDGVSSTPPYGPAADPARLREVEEALAMREQGLLSLEKSLVEREALLGQAFARISAREHALEQREEDLSIREAALEEAMALAAEMEVEPVSVEGAPDAEEGDLLEGPAEIDEDLLDASEASEAVRSAPPAAVDAGRLEEEARKAQEAAKAEEARRAEELKRVRIESEQLVALLAEVPFLQFVEPRVKRAQADGALDLAAMLGFYGLVSRLLKEELDKNKLLIQRYEKDYQQDLREKDKALVDAKAAVTSLQEDFDRYRNRAKSEQEGLTTRASEELLRRVVPIFDNFERALAASTGAANMEAVVSGVQMIYRQFEDVLRQEGLVAIRVSRGEEFNPKIHEALMEIETTEVAEDLIFDEIQRGYMLGGKLFRPALVKVARRPSVAQESV